MEFYTVRPGDTLYGIAARYGETAELLARNNGIGDPDRLAVGQTLVITPPTAATVIRTGQTREEIAAENGLSVRELKRHNPGADWEAGETVVLSYGPAPERKIVTNGYAYPFIDRDVLSRTLPYLDELTVFAYGFTPEGTLVIPDDGETVRMAAEEGTKPILLFSTLSEAGTFSNELAHLLLGSEELRERLLNELIGIMREKGYRGIDVDFEYVLPEDRERYAAFLRRVAGVMGENGFTTAVSLAPKTYAGQPGLLYEAHDYPLLGAAADTALVMTYEWGYTYGPPEAVSPLNKVRAVMEYAVSEIAPEKLTVGVPNYGYDWRLPYVRGESKAESLGNLAAIARAVERNAEIRFDGTAAAPWYRYFASDGEHEVWFNDPRSAAGIASLVPALGLRGVSVWNVMRFDPPLWLTLAGLYRIG